MREVHDVRLRAADGGYFGIFHCRVDPETTVETAHREVDALERALRDLSPKSCASSGTSNRRAEASTVTRGEIAPARRALYVRKSQ